MIALALMLAVQDAAPVIDQTNDIAVVAAFLDALRLKDNQRATQMLAANAIIRNYDGKVPTPLANFAKYSEGCGLRAVLAGMPFNPTQRMDIEANWDCSKFGFLKVRQANFVVRDGKITEVRWGELPKWPQPTIKPVEKR